MSYRIKSVAALTGIPATTLRAWERRYDVVAPGRTDGGYRVYSEEDVAALARVKALVDRGYRVGEAIEMVRRGVPELSRSDVSAEVLDRIREDLLEALLAIDRPTALDLFDRLATLPFDRQLGEVLLPLLRDVGDRWSRGEISVVQEHFCSAFARGRMVTMMESLAGGARRGKEALFAGAPGERHELGLMAAAIHLAMRGWRITYLGADVPIAQLRAVLEERRPVLLCTSVIRDHSEAECRQLLESLRAVCTPRTTVVVGGAGLAPGLPSTPAPNCHFVRDLESLARVGPVHAA